MEEQIDIVLRWIPPNRAFDQEFVLEWPDGEEIVSTRHMKEMVEFIKLIEGPINLEVF
jgi:hypothetical protein